MRVELQNEHAYADAIATTHREFGRIADMHGTATAFLVLVGRFAIVAVYGWQVARADAATY